MFTLVSLKSGWADTSSWKELRAVVELMTKEVPVLSFLAALASWTTSELLEERGRD